MELSLSSICLFNEYRTNNELKSGQQQKIKQRLKLLRNYLCQYTLIKIKWINFDYFKGIIFIFSHGVISSICFDVNYSLLSVYHDNFILNKLTSKRISTIDITERFILISYVEPYLACILLEDNFKAQTYTKFKLKNNCAFKQINLKKYITSSAKRNLTVSNQYALIWWNSMPYRHNWTSNSSSNERNVIMFSFDDFSVIETNPINGEILQAEFFAKEPNKYGIIHKQKGSAYNLTYMLFELTPPDVTSTINRSNVKESNVTNKLIFEINIPIDKLCFFAEFTKTQDKILLLCDDESVMLFNIEQNVLYSLHSSMPICFISAYPLDTIFATCDQNGTISFYDNALNNIHYKIKRKVQPTGLAMTNVCNNTNQSVKRLQFLSPNILVTLMVENRRQDNHGVANGNTNGGTNNCCLKINILPYKISFKRLINEYLYLNKYGEALNMLRIINWNCSYEEAYLCLHSIFQHLIKLPFENEIDGHIESTLAAFLIPMTPIDYKIFEKILPYIRQLAIRFFYHLLRNGSLQRAYQLGIELKSPRLFLLLAQLFKLSGNEEYSIKSYDQAKNLL